MKIEAGKRYVTRAGEVVGPMVREVVPSGTQYVWGAEDASFLSWTDTGREFGGLDSPDDLVSEYVESAPGPLDTAGAALSDAIPCDAYDTAAQDALAEVRRAKAAWPGEFNSAHEGFAILNEEFDELRGHVWTNQKRRDLAAMRKEAIQVAAMALRFAAECCDETTGRK
jgi:hypothetical protein